MAVKHTGENIRNTVKEILDEFAAWRPNNTYITDNAANMKLAMKDQSWLGCSGHNINLVLAHGLREAKNNENQEDGEQDGEQAEDFMSDVVQLISVCKGIVAR